MRADQDHVAVELVGDVEDRLRHRRAVALDPHLGVEAELSRQLLSLLSGLTGCLLDQLAEPPIERVVGLLIEPERVRVHPLRRRPYRQQHFRAFSSE